MSWRLNKLVKRYPKLKDPVLIEGLPGIGNVGKVALDFMMDQLDAKPLVNFESYSLPNTVFVNEDNLIELPSIQVYYKKVKKGKNDLLFLAGDVQPINEQASYEFSDAVLDFIEELNCKEIVTLGGIGLQEAPKSPKVYCTGNSKGMVKKYQKVSGVNTKLYGVVGPIMGVSGLLLGLSEKRNIGAVSLLAETMGHPMYLGVKGAKETLKVLNKRFGLKVSLTQLDKEIKEVEAEITNKTEDYFSLVSKKMKNAKRPEDIEYIG